VLTSMEGDRIMGLNGKAESADPSDPNSAEESNGTTPSSSPNGRRFAIPREFTNYDRNAHTWRNGTAEEIFDRAAKPLAEEAPAGSQ